MRKLTWLVLALSLLSFAEPVFAQQGISAVTVTTNQDGTQDYSMTLQALFIMTALSLIPAFIMMMTSFTRIIVVLSILRQAIGLQQSPSNQILIGVSLFLSMFIMAPVFDEVNERALQPYLNEQLTSLDALEQAKGPMRAFMLSQTRVKDLETFVRIAGDRFVVLGLASAAAAALWPPIAAPERRRRSHGSLVQPDGHDRSTH